MYEERTIPSKKYNSCGLCPHHSNRLLRSGRNPIRDHYCTHPNFVGNKPEFKFMGESTTGKKIGSDDRTPKWCPFIPQNGKRSFSQITPEECLKIVTEFYKIPSDWKVRNANKEVYEGGGYKVKSDKNHFSFIFDFELENIVVWDTGIDEEKHMVDIKTNFQIVNFLNARNIFFSWQK